MCTTCDNLCIQLSDEKIQCYMPDLTPNALKQQKNLYIDMHVN